MTLARGAAPASIGLGAARTTALAARGSTSLTGRIDAVASRGTSTTATKDIPSVDAAARIVPDSDFASHTTWHMYPGPLFLGGTADLSCFARGPMRP